MRQSIRGFGLLAVVFAVVAIAPVGTGAPNAAAAEPTTPVNLCVGEKDRVRVAESCNARETAVSIASADDVAAVASRGDKVTSERWQREHLDPVLSVWVPEVTYGRAIVTGYGLKPNNDYFLFTGEQCPFTSDANGRVATEVDCIDAFLTAAVFDRSAPDGGETEGFGSRIFNSFSAEIEQGSHCGGPLPSADSVRPCALIGGDTTQLHDALMEPDAAKTAETIRLCVDGKSNVSAPVGTCRGKQTELLVGNSGQLQEVAAVIDNEYARATAEQFLDPRLVATADLSSSPDTRLTGWGLPPGPSVYEQIGQSGQRCELGIQVRANGRVDVAESNACGALSETACPGRSIIELAGALDPDGCASPVYNHYGSQIETAVAPTTPAGISYGWDAPPSPAELPFQLCVDDKGSVAASTGACGPRATSVLLSTEAQLQEMASILDVFRARTIADDFLDPHLFAVEDNQFNLQFAGWGLPVGHHTYGTFSDVGSGFCAVGLVIAETGRMNPGQSQCRPGNEFECLGRAVAEISAPFPHYDSANCALPVFNSYGVRMHTDVLQYEGFHEEFWNLLPAFSFDADPF